MELTNDDIYTRKYGTDFERKIEQLSTIITEGQTQHDDFNVIALEAGLGKSKYTERIIDEYLYDIGASKKYLVVKKFKEDVVEMEKFLQHHNQPKDSFDLPSILGITSDNWSKWKLRTEDLKNIDVIIITHKRYIDLCLDDDLREAFRQDRDVLIIDEKVTFPIYSFSKTYYDNVRSILPFNLQNEFDKVSGKLRKELQKQDVQKNHNKCVRVEPNIHPATLNNFLDLMEVNINNIRDLKKRNYVQHFLEGLELWYYTKCVYNGGNITTFNRKHVLWGLKNNIILDASASLDGVYNISNKYNVVGETRIVDHSDSTFYQINFNASKSNIHYYQDKYFDEIIEKIIQYNDVNENDQTLIICHKDNYERIQKGLLKKGITDINVPGDPLDERNDNEIEERFAINWFGNLIGKNAYVDFTQCWIIGTPNLPYEQYLMHYLMYAREEHLGNKSLEIVQGRFRNDAFNKVQTGYIASEIYQSIKRIQRNAKPKGKFFIVNSDYRIVESVIGMIKGATWQETINLQFDRENKQQTKKDNTDVLIEHIRMLPIGSYPKKQIRDEVKITNLNRHLTDYRIKDMVQTGYIQINYRSIEKLK